MLQYPDLVRVAAVCASPRRLFTAISTRTAISTFWWMPFHRARNTIKGDPIKGGRNAAREQERCDLRRRWCNRRGGSPRLRARGHEASERSTRISPLAYPDRSFSLGLRSFSCNTTLGDHRKGGNHVEAELAAFELERQSFRLWRNGEDGSWCLGRCGISAYPAAAFRADLKGNC